MELLSANEARDIQKTEGKAYYDKQLNEIIKNIDLDIKNAAEHNKDRIYTNGYKLVPEIYDILKKRGYKVTKYNDDYGTVQIKW